MGLGELINKELEDKYEEFDSKRHKYSLHSAFSSLAGAFIFGNSVDHISLDNILTVPNSLCAVSIVSLCYSGFALYKASHYIKQQNNFRLEYAKWKQQKISEIK